jgi:diguanylate cyclase (GGDEF)-like protein/PAS domain S-box-containing protein
MKAWCLRRPVVVFAFLSLAAFGLGALANALSLPPGWIHFLFVLPLVSLFACPRRFSLGLMLVVVLVSFRVYSSAAPLTLGTALNILVPALMVILLLLAGHHLIEQSRRTLEQLAESERRYRNLLYAQGEGVVVKDEEQTFVFANPAADEIFGVPAGTLVGRSLRDFLPPEEIEKIEAESEKRHRGLSSTYDLKIQRPDGEPRDLLVTASPYYSHRGELLGSVAIVHDITQRKQDEEKLRYDNLHDALTGLYNRRFFEEEVRRLDQSGPFPVSVLMIDVDGLKRVNDAFGHETGDRLIITVADILHNCLRGEDRIIRLGGDEFVVLMLCSDERAVRRVSERIRQAVDEENRRGQYPFEISISLGGAVCMESGGLRTAIHQADRNMYREKRARNGQLGEAVETMESR